MFNVGRLYDGALREEWEAEGETGWNSIFIYQIEDPVDLQMIGDGKGYHERAGNTKPTRIEYQASPQPPMFNHVELYRVAYKRGKNCQRRSISIFRN